MQYGQTQNKGWKKVGRVFLHGVGAPALSYIRNAPGDELLETASEEGRDPAETNARIKSILLSVFKSHQQKGLVEAKQGHQRELARISEGQFNLPKTASRRRRLPECWS
jgi:hypothetical protein